MYLIIYHNYICIILYILVISHIYINMRSCYFAESFTVAHVFGMWEARPDGMKGLLALASDSLVNRFGKILDMLSRNKHQANVITLW